MGLVELDAFELDTFHFLVAYLNVESGGKTPIGINRSGEDGTYLILVGVAIGDRIVEVGGSVGGKTTIENSPGTAVDRALDLKIVFVAGSIVPDNV